MFYSHTFLAKKSPLGTVWIAAHLERRIKKPQIEGIDIPSYADHIIAPEVPIALRMSGHLLLGLVRIYSWKVNYLVQDCNRMLTYIRTVFASVRVELPAEADHAPFESVTLPNTFELDAVELDESRHQLDAPDNHLTTYEEITLTDQATSQAESYVAVYMNDEEDRVYPSPILDPSNLVTEPIDEDILPSVEVGLDALSTPIESANLGAESSLNVQDFSKTETSDGRFSQSFPEIEIMRDADNHLEATNILAFDDTEINIGFDDNSIPTINLKDSLSPIMEAASLSIQIDARADTSASLNDLDISRAGISLAHPDLAIQHSPVVQHAPELKLQTSPVANVRRKRKLGNKGRLVDGEIVLNNKFMKAQLENTGDILRQRRLLPQKQLGIRKFYVAKRKEHIFSEGLLQGMPTRIQEAFKRSFPVCSNLDTPEASPGPSKVQSHDLDMEPERPRLDIQAEEHLSDAGRSPFGREEFTPSGPNTTLSVAESEKNLQREAEETFEPAPTSGIERHELESPSFPGDQEQAFDNMNHPEIPGLLCSADEDLNFLEESTSSDSQVISIDKMSARSRAVMEYLKRHSPSTQASKDQPGSWSLNKIIEGKNRRQCARMFYETLVLKSLGFINVHQDEVYGDILISPTPALSTTKV